GLRVIAGPGGSADFDTVTLYVPGSTPSPLARVDRRKCPFSSVTAFAGGPPLSSRWNTTSAPATGWSSSSTSPSTLRSPLPPQPPAHASTAARSRPARVRGRFRWALISVVPRRDDLAVVAAAELLVGLVTDRLAQEMHRAVGEGEVDPARVPGLEAHRHPPVAQVMSPVVGAAGAGQDLVVERDDGRATAVAEVARPAPVRRLHVLVLRRQGLADEQGVGGAVGDAGDVDRRPLAVEHAPHVVGVGRVLVAGAGVAPAERVVGLAA